MKSYFEIDEPITKVFIMESISKKGYKVEHLIINDRWKLSATGNPKKPFRKSRISKGLNND